MARIIKLSPSYQKRLDDTYDKNRHIPGLNKKIEKDLEFVVELLQEDKPIPPKYKDHKVGNDGDIPIKELHLTSRGSNILLVYKKYDNILYLVGVVTHKDMNHILHGFTQDDLLLDEEDVKLILGE